MTVKDLVKPVDVFMDKLQDAVAGKTSALIDLVYANKANYLKDPETIEKIQNFFETSKEGVVLSKLYVALCHGYGLTVPRDYDASTRVLTEIIETQSVSEEEKHYQNVAHYILGYFWRKGDSESRPKDYEKSFHHFMMAAEQGFAPAQYWVGKCYQFGYGVDHNLDKAVAWYKQGVRNGSGEACCLLSDIYALPPSKKNKYANLGKAFQGYQIAICYGEEKNAVQHFLSLAEKAHKIERTDKGLSYIFSDGTSALLREGEECIAHLVMARKNCVSSRVREEKNEGVLRNIFENYHSIRIRGLER